MYSKYIFEKLWNLPFTIWMKRWIRESKKQEYLLWRGILKNRTEEERKCWKSCGTAAAQWQDRLVAKDHRMFPFTGHCAHEYGSPAECRDNTLFPHGGYQINSRPDHAWILNAIFSFMDDGEHGKRWTLWWTMRHDCQHYFAVISAGLRSAFLNLWRTVGICKQCLEEFGPTTSSDRYLFQKGSIPWQWWRLVPRKSEAISRICTGILISE